MKLFRKGFFHGFTITEISVVCIVLSLFMTGLFSLYRSGQNAGSQAFWIQNTVSQLRNASRHISQTIQKSSYPATIVFPQKILENTRNDFMLHYTPKGTLSASQAKKYERKSTPGTLFLRAVECMPEKRGFQSDTQAVFNYHIYSLTKEGRLLYHRFEESIPFTSPDAYIQDVGKSQIPPKPLAPVESLELVSDVDSVGVKIQGNSRSDGVATAPPVIVDITCVMPNAHTKRSERIIGVPNVDAMEHDRVDPDW